MNILITGGAGFLGSNLTSFLLKAGHEVTVVDNLTTGSRSNVDEYQTNTNFHFYELSVDDPSFLAEFSNLELHHFDQIYHLACPTGVPNIDTLGEEMMDACSFGTKQVLKVALLHQAKLLFTSSSEVYGNALVSPQAESYTGNVDPRGPRANYEEGKRFAETLVALFVEKCGLRAVTVRLFNIYGPRMSLADTRVIPRFVSQTILERPLTLHGEGEQERTFCFVSDAIAGLSLIMEKGISGEVYNLGSDESITMRFLAEKVIAVIGSDSKIVSLPRANHDHESRIPLLNKVRALGWKQKVSLKDGLKQTIADFSHRLGRSPSPEKVTGFLFWPAR